VLRLPDGARLHAGAETRLRVVADEVTLETGTLAVDVPPRARVFQTPHAQVRAHGSRFTLSVDATSTLCKVEDGRVALFDVLGAASVEVAAGHYAIATSQAELKSEPLVAPAAAGPSIRLIAPARWPQKYGIWPFRPGALIYGDRGYRITDMPPELEGALGIATMAEDRRSADAELLVFELDREASVWVGIDGRAAQDLGKLPAWLAGWERTGLKIHSLTAGNSYYHLFRKRFPAGRVALGGNHQGGDTGAKVNYTVLVTAPR
jgi:hypothetical protein